jgi:FAD dependent monooxygenase
LYSKVTPNAGHGGNTAIESVAVLANLLYDVKIGTEGSLDYTGLQDILKRYRRNRKDRVDYASGASSAATRIQARANLGWKAVASLLPLLGEDFEVNASSDLIMGGEALKFIDDKGKEGNIPWDGWTADDIDDDLKTSSTSQIVRNLAIPVAVTVWFIRQIQLMPGPTLSTSVSTHGFDSSEIINFFLGFNVSKTFAVPSAALADEIPPKLWPTFFACMNLLPIGAIIAIEGCRSNNAKSLSTM